MSEHYTKNTVSVSAWCAQCGKQTMHRVDAGQRGPCLECIEKKQKVQTVFTACFFCTECQAWTIHDMENEGWKKGQCLDCRERALNRQGDLFR